MTEKTLPECYNCGLVLDDDDVWYNCDFAAGEDETTKWTCPNSDCKAVNLTTVVVTTTFETEKFESEYHDEPDQEWDGS